jgi:hypothetical protein
MRVNPGSLVTLPNQFKLRKKRGKSFSWAEQRPKFGGVIEGSRVTSKSATFF